MIVSTLFLSLLPTSVFYAALLWKKENPHKQSRNTKP